jgi:hypothetical protein
MLCVLNLEPHGCSVVILNRSAHLCHCDCNISSYNVYYWVARLCSPWPEELLHWRYIDVIFYPLLVQCIK